MANKRLTEVKINAVDVSGDLLSWEIDRDFGKPIDEANLKFTRNVNTTVVLKVGQTVVIKDGYSTATDVTEFSGELITFEPDGGVIKVKAFNKLYAAVRTQITKVYDPTVGGDPTNPNGEISLAFHDLVTVQAGLSATHGTDIQDSGTTLVITQFVCDNTDIKERADRLSEALNWVYYYDANDDKVKFHPKQTTTNNAILFIGGTALPTLGKRVSNVPKWKYDKTDLINDLRVDGVFQLDQFEDKFSGDASTTKFTLTHTPIGDIALYYGNTVNLSTTATLETQLQTLEITSATASGNYKVDRLLNTFTTTSFTPSNNTNNLLVRYQIARAIPVHYRDDDSVVEFGLHARTIQLTDTVTVADVEARTTEVVEKFKIPFQSATLEVPNSSGLLIEMGDSVRVIDEISNPTIDDFFTVFGVTLRYPDGFDDIRVGDREFDPPEFYINTGERLHRLERELLDENTILSEIRKVNFPFKVEPHSLVITQELINDSFILGHTTNGQLHVSTDNKVLSDFENPASWQDDFADVTLSETLDGTAGHFVEGVRGLNYSWTDTSGIAAIRNVVSQGDLSAITGVSSGSPTKGTIGLWVYTPDASDISAMKLRIGSSSSDYKEYNAATYAVKVGGIGSGFSLVDDLAVYVLFNLDSEDATAGTTDWENIDFLRIFWTVSAAGDATFDYITIWDNDTIGLNGIGNRAKQLSSTTTNY